MAGLSLGREVDGEQVVDLAAGLPAGGQARGVGLERRLDAALDAARSAGPCASGSTASATEANEVSRVMASCFCFASAMRLACWVALVKYRSLALPSLIGAGNGDGAIVGHQAPRRRRRRSLPGRRCTAASR